MIDPLQFALRYSVLAPSSHNTQPWVFRTQGNCVELHADRKRRLPVVDPEDRALIISCGAALCNLVLAIRQQGFEANVEVVANRGESLLARVKMGEPRPATTKELELFEAIGKRHTCRLDFETASVTEAVAGTLAGALLKPWIWLRLLDPPTQILAADLIAEGDRMQATSADFRKELASWVRPNFTLSRDGMPGTAFGISTLMSVVFPAILRTVNWGKGQGEKDRRLALAAPLLAVLGTGEDTPKAWLEAGESLERVLLMATSKGLSYSFFNQPIEVPSLRPRLASLTGAHGLPQILLRFGYGPAAKPTPRRELEEVLMEGSQ